MSESNEIKMTPKDKCEQIEKGENWITKFWNIRGYEKVTHIMGMNIHLHLKDIYVHNGLSLQYLEQFEEESVKRFKSSLLRELERIREDVNLFASGCNLEHISDLKEKLDKLISSLGGAK